MLDYEEAKTWFYRCLRCGTCKYIFGLYLPSCPAGEMFSFESYYSSGKLWIGRGLAEGKLSFADPSLLQKLYACTTCGSCQVQCSLPVGEHSVDIFEALRAEAVRQGYGPMPGQKHLLESIKNYDNPWVQPRQARERWARGLEIKDLSKEKARVLYYVGCTAELDPQLHQIARSTVEILQRAGVDFGWLGREEVCCGSVAMRLGDREDFRRLAENNIERFNELGVETIITSCAGCYKTITQDYPSVGKINAEVVHSSQFVQRLLQQKKLSFKKKVELTLTYHDPCHLGRHREVYDEPRQVLQSIKGINFVEMRRTRENSWCCGGGGGVRAGFPDFAQETAILRIKEAEEVGAEGVVSTCPFCFQNIAGGIAAANSPLKMIDLTEIVSRAIR
ncbi:MAG: (Fe-S)-binding protein [Deltaproteobacteria bacterium]|nr:MAG: (Fe-S)-binding protein [Deltaproteobacteria bacterium]